MGRIFAVGNNKTFKVSINDGVTFINTLGIIPNMSTNNLRAVDSWDENLVLCAGYDLKIFRSTNGGNSWASINMPAIAGSSNVYCARIKWVTATIVFSLY
ncbi:MAG: hypothetical protein ACRC78_09130, partial [Planktothrix sp.]